MVNKSSSLCVVWLDDFWHFSQLDRLRFLKFLSLHFLSFNHHSSLLLFELPFTPVELFQGRYAGWGLLVTSIALDAWCLLQLKQLVNCVKRVGCLQRLAFYLIQNCLFGATETVSVERCLMAVL